MKKAVCYPMLFLALLCSAGYAFADNHGSGREEAGLKRDIQELKAVVDDMRAAVNAQANQRSAEQDRAYGDGPCYERGHHNYYGCRRSRHHY